MHGSWLSGMISIGWSWPPRNKVCPIWATPSLLVRSLRPLVPYSTPALGSVMFWLIVNRVSLAVNQPLIILLSLVQGHLQWCNGHKSSHWLAMNFSKRQTLLVSFSHCGKQILGEANGGVAEVARLTWKAQNMNNLKTVDNLDCLQWSRLGVQWGSQCQNWPMEINPHYALQNWPSNMNYLAKLTEPKASIFCKPSSTLPPPANLASGTNLSCPTIMLN